MTSFSDSSAQAVPEPERAVRSLPIARIATAVLLAAAAAGVAAAIVTSQSIAEQAAANDKAIGQLETELAGLASEPAVTAEEVEAQLVSCREAGAAAAKAADTLSLGHVDSAGFDEAAEALQALLSDSDKALGVPWFSPETTSLSWQFMCDYEYGGGTLPVVWLCNVSDSEGKGRPSGIGAWATAIYDSETGLFRGLDYGTTALGNEYVASDAEKYGEVA